MKVIVVAAAALAALVPAVAAGAAAPAPVVASPAPLAAPQDRVVVRERTVVRHEEHRGWRTRNRCDWRWRGGHRVRVCRSVRYRY